MATPIIEVIEDCEQDIKTFRSELEVIIAEADEDGVRDEEETKEIKDFEDSIAELEEFVTEKRAELEKNKAEWEGLSSKVSELMADFQTLTDWGEPALQPLDQRIIEMDKNADSMFFRDAINSFEAAQTILDPLMEAYNKQSAAKLTYDEELKAAKQRVDACHQSELLAPDIIARIDQLETDFVSCEVLTEDLDYVTALSTMPGMVEEISLVEGMIEGIGETEERLQVACGEMLKKRQDALNELEPHQEFMLAFLDEVTQAEKTVDALLNDKDFEQAELQIAQTEQFIAESLERIPALEAEVEKREADEALLAKERDQLASELSASRPEVTLWKLYEWREGDSFEKLSSDCGAKNASILLGYPNNKKLSEYYQSNNELPVGTLVCVIDPTVKIFKMIVEGEKIFLTEDALAGYVAEHSKLTKTIAANLYALFINLETNNTTASDARNSFGWLTQYMTGWDVDEPVMERDKARASTKALLGSFDANNADQFASLVVTAAADCQAYRAALKDWLAEMQTELKATMDSLAFYEGVAKTCVIVGVLTIAVPASIPAAALYAGCTAAGLSVFSDTIKVVAAAGLGAESPVSLTDVATNAISAGLNAAVSTAIFGGIFSKLGPAIATRISSISVVETQAGRLFQSTLWSGKIVRLVPGTIHIDELAALVAPAVVQAYLKLFGRIAWGSAGGLKGVVETGATKFMDDNPDALNAPNEDVLATTIANEILDDATINEIFDVILQEHATEFEDILAEELRGLDLETVE